jgi:capsular exopolysaccharide synthesis family protein
MDEIKSNENEYVHLIREKGAEAPESIAKRQQLDVVKARYDQLSRSKIAGQIGYTGRAQKYNFDIVSDKLKIERKLNELNFSATEFKRLKQYYENQLARLPIKEQDYIRLQRDREAVSKTYVFLKEKLDETRILLGSEVGSVSIVGAAFKPVEPDKPDLKSSILVGLLCGAFFAALYTYGAESIDDTIKDKSFFRLNRLGRIFMIPFVARDVRLLNSDKGNSRALVAFSADDGVETGDAGSVTNISMPRLSDIPTSPFAESFRTLRAQLDLLSGGLSHSILISGTIENEGKSTVCANLGIVFAMAGRKTLIIDCDMQHAVQHLAFGCERAPGLSDFLIGHEKTFTQQIIQRTNIENLFVLSSGREIVNSSELLGSGKMAVLLKGLKEQFDTILLDSPSLFLSDSVQLAQFADGILLVSRLGYTCKKSVHDLIMDEFYSPRILGVVVIDSAESTQKTRNRFQLAS